MGKKASYRKCSSCSIEVIKSDFWQMGFGYKLCDDCYQKDFEEDIEETNLKYEGYYQ